MVPVTALGFLLCAVALGFSATRSAAESPLDQAVARFCPAAALLLGG